MHIIYNKWTNLAEGYKFSSDTSVNLSREWRGKLDALSKQLAPVIVKNNAQQRILLLLSIASLFVILAISLKFIFMLVALPLSAYFYIRHWLIKKDTDKVAYPPALDILPAWWQRIEEGYGRMDKDGDIGEVEFLDDLDKCVSDNHIATRALLVDKHLDIDVLVLGETGVWNFESKYYSDEVIYKNGQWSRDRGSRNDLLPERDSEIKRGFDEQWLNETKELQRTLEKRGGQTGLELSKNIKGGIVFTHPDVELSIDSNCPVKCGDNDFWINEIKNAPAINHFDTHSLLRTLDALIAYSDLCQAEQRSSAVELAKEISRTAEDRLQKYLDSCQGYLAKVSTSLPQAETAPVVSPKESSVPGDQKLSFAAKPAPIRRVNWWLVGGVSLIAFVLICGAATFLVSGLNSPQVCATSTTKFYAKPISSAETTGTINNNSCVPIDGRTAGGWGRVTGLNLYRGKWIYLGVFKFNPKQVNDLPILKP